MTDYRVCYRCRCRVEKGYKHKCTPSSKSISDSIGNGGIYNTKRWRVLRDYCKATYIVCARCGGIDSIEAHHIYKVSRHIDKAYDIDNICLLCKVCHSYVDRNCLDGTLDFNFKRYEYKYNI